MPIVFILLFLIAGVLASATSFFLWRSYRTSKNYAVLFLTLMFGFLGIYALMVSLPVILFANNPDVVGFWRIVALMLIFGVILISIPVQRAISSGSLKTISLYLFGVFSVLAVAALFDLVSNYQTPVIGPYIVEWRASTIGLWIVGISSFAYGLLWSFVFLRDSKKAEQKQQRFKLQVLAADGVVLGLAGLIGFLGTEVWHTYTAIGLLIFAILITLIMVIDPTKNGKSASQDLS